MELAKRVSDQSQKVSDGPWPIETLRTHLSRGATYGIVKAGRYRTFGVRMVRGGDIKASRINRDLPRIAPEKSEEYSRTVLSAGDVVIALVGYPGEAAVVPPELEGANVSRAVGVLRPIPPLRADYLVTYLNSPIGRAEFLRPSAGSAQIVVNLGALNKLQIPLPDPEEQQAIADALSDVDALLDGLDRLIAKKRDLKQAAMQRLLTGKTRLPGFSKDWDPVAFGDLAAPGTDRVDPRITGRHAFCVELEHIEQQTGRLLGWSETGAQTSLKAVFQPDDVLFGKLRAYLRKYWHATRSGVCSTEIWVLKAKPGRVTPGYLYQLVQTDWFIEAASTAYGTHMPRSDWKVVRELELRVPGEDEQAKIAEVLGDMDAEIDALELRRAKTHDLKIAMMQELLTGKTRLVGQDLPAAQEASTGDKKQSHNWAFNEAVVISTLVNRFGKEDYPLGRKRYTKLSYLLHRRVERRAEGYLKKAAGPYNPKTKYAGPEKIAKTNGYILQHKGPKGHSGFIAADNIAQAEGYFEKWYGPDVLQWLEQFRFKKNDELEVLATVDMATVELHEAGMEVNVASVKSVISNHPEWEAKLDRAAFSDANIAAAIELCGELFFEEVA